ncbi:AMP-binding protein [Minwuia sp.]|uniref:AMP-binding protein n=1 Tax=Minwuia sp. TaxID=2493630 RepID=UPI003A8F514D
MTHFRDRETDRAASFVTASGRLDLTFGDMALDCRRFAETYRHQNLAEGSTVLIFLRHVPQLYGSFFGAMLAGYVPALMPCSSPRQDPELYWQSHNKLLRKIRPSALVADRETFAEMRSAGLDMTGIIQIAIETVANGAGAATFTPPPADRIALLQHSSGTTGLKKGVRLSFEAIQRQVDSYAATLRASSGDRVVSWLPLYHDMGLIACMITPAFLGIPVTHIDPFHWLTRPAMLLDLLQRDRGTLCWLPNFAFEHLALTSGRRAGEFDLSHVRAFINCSEPCKPSTFDRFATAFAAAGVRPGQLQCCYAMAETVFAVSQTELDRPPARISVDANALRETGQVIAVPEAAEGDDVLDLIESGRVLDGLSVEIRDDSRAALGDDRVGEIAISGAFLFDGYNEDPERTAAKLDKGWYHTGDKGFTHDGHLFVLGRTDDLMIVNGRNIYCHEAEAELAQIAGLKPGRAVVLGHEDERVGSQVMLVLAERDPASSHPDADVRRQISDRLFSVFQVMPRSVELVDPGWLIKTTSGKIGRAANLAKFLEQQSKGRADGRQ